MKKCLFKIFAGLGLAIVLPAFAGDSVDQSLLKINTRMIEGGNGVPIALTQWGNPEGTEILLVHGFLSSTINWDKQINSDLGNTFNMAAVDLRGHGSAGKPWLEEDYTNSQLWADDLAAAIKAAGFKKPLLVAWSYGGLFVMDYLRHYGSDDLSGIIVADGNAGLVAPPPPTEDTPDKLARIERSRSANLDTIMAWTNGFMSYMTSDGELPADELQKVVTSAMLVPHYVRRHLREKSTDNSDLLEMLDIPLLFIVGSKSGLALEHTKGLAKESGLIDQKVYEDRLTMTMWYEAEQFNQDIKAFSRRAQ